MPVRFVDGRPVSQVTQDYGEWVSAQLAAQGVKVLLWMHGQRAIVEPQRKLTATEMRERVCAHFGCAHLEPLKQNKQD